MKYIIIEDEDPAARRLEKMIKEILPSSEMIQHLVSVKSSVQYLKNHSNPDLIFLDIQLGDGHSFEIFNSVVPDCPVIFVTAYNQFAIQAFKLDSIDYLLKPVRKEDLEKALSKFSKRSTPHQNDQVDFSKLVSLLKSQTELQKRIMIRFGDVIKVVEIDEVAYFYTENKINFLCTFDNKTYPIDQNLDQVEAMVNPKIFFRINRQFIVNIKSISKMVSYSKSRVKLELKPVTTIETIVSTERSPHFKGWLTGTE